jgi:Fe-S cluster assembly iron-binding protein IscA
MIKLEANAVQVIKTSLAERGCRLPIRIQLQSNGCCDPILSLRVDKIRESDLIQEIDGLTFVIGYEIYQLLGDVTVFYKDEPAGKGFVITSAKPISEWEGFAVSTIQF